jgi:RND family efflux transporter MFP subunit
MIGLAACSKPESVVEEIVRPVVTVVVPERGAVRQRAFSGVAKAAVETLLSFRVGGEILELPIRKGVAVEVGSLMARLDARDYELQVKQTEAELAQADAQLEQANAEYERMRQLYEAQSISKSDLDSQLAAFKSARAQHDAARKAVELAEQQLNYCTLLAPVNGVIASVPVEAHQTVQAGQTIATLTSGEQMELEVGIPELLISDLNVGDHCRVMFDAVPAEEFKAEISEIGVSVNESSTFPVTLRLDRKDARIRSGMVGEAFFSFQAAADHQAVVIPAVAVFSAGGAPTCWVFDTQTETVNRRTLEIGTLTPEGLEVFSGIEPGEHVVTRGVHQLTEDMRVRLLDE